ncbi:MAG: hypothetical protein EOP87_19115 [Verrucomicrobiaceae bacterium]|nr:MAG: hypothetical protein EOP87_19115 [Verrucomicrobiaceae bacterium]
MGKGNVGIPFSENTHRPDVFRLLPPLTPFPALPEKTPSAISCSLPLHRFRPPEPVTVASALREELPVPMAILTGKHKGRIDGRQGPFGLSAGWWDDRTAWQTIEWDIELNGRFMRLTFSRPESWWIEGIYL